MLGNWTFLGLGGRWYSWYGWYGCSNQGRQLAVLAALTKKPCKIAEIESANLLAVLAVSTDLADSISTGGRQQPALALTGAIRRWIARTKGNGQAAN